MHKSWSGSQSARTGSLQSKTKPPKRFESRGEYHLPAPAACAYPATFANRLFSSSVTVGWVNTASRMSAAVQPSSRKRFARFTISGAPVQYRWMPSTRPVALSTTPFMSRASLPKSGTFGMSSAVMTAQATSNPWSRASCSVRPTWASGGSAKMQDGTAPRVPFVFVPSPSTSETTMR